MEKDTLVAYIATERARGVTDENIRTELLTKGWGEQEVRNVLGTGASDAAIHTSDKLPGVFALLKETKNIYMKSLQFFSIISLILFIPMFLMTYVTGSMKGTASQMFSGDYGQVPLVIFLYIGIIMLITPSVLLALAHNELSDVGLALKKGSKKMGRYFLFSLATGFIIIAGFILLIIPGIIFSVWYAFVGVISILEEETLGIGDALRRSKSYVKGRWWSIFWRMFGGSISLYLIYTILCFIIGLVFGFMHITSDLTNTLVASLLGGFYISMTFVYSYTLYVRTKASRA